MENENLLILKIKSCSNYLKFKKLHDRYYKILNKEIKNITFNSIKALLEDYICCLFFVTKANNIVFNYGQIFYTPIALNGKILNERMIYVFDADKFNNTFLKDLETLIIKHESR